MILQALYDYYQRKAADPESGIAPLGFEWKPIPFIIVIDEDGKFVTLEDTRTGEGKNKQARTILVPQGLKRSVGVRANLLWDNLEYATGANPRDRKDIAERAAAFRTELASRLPDPQQDLRVKALLAFIDAKPAEQISQREDISTVWEDALSTNANVTFRLDGDSFPTLCDAFHEHIGCSAPVTGESRLCLVSAETGPVESIHPSIKGVRGAQSSGASLVSFNLDAFTSFGKKQNLNAPVSTNATFAYTTALNALLSKGSNNRVSAGDATVVFWSEGASEFEKGFADLFTLAPKNDPDREVRAVRAVYESLSTGAANTESSTRFFVLGLSPNASRLSVRFWHQGTTKEFASHISQHFDDLEIIRGPKDIGRYSMFWLLKELGTEGKLDNVPPNLAGGIVRSVLAALPYPAPLLQQAVRRIRAEQTVNRMRAAILKAYLNRYQRTYPNQEKEIAVSLDQENTNVGYRLGRLFAVLEKIQEDANPGLNATIRDRYYGAASANPVTVFPQLLKLKNHHLKKLNNPRFVGAHERRLGEIFSGLAADMPSHLRMDDQARFAVGYYHQRQALFTKASKDDPPDPQHD